MSMQCKSAGVEGVVYLIARRPNGDRYKHPLTGARVKVVTNRFSGLTVELVNGHGQYRQGERVVIAPGDLVTDPNLMNLIA